MQIANVRLKMAKVGNDTPLSNVTPAEAMLLHILHGPANGGETFGEDQKHIVVVGEAMVDTGKTRTVVDKPEVKYVAPRMQVGVPGEKGYIPAVIEVKASEAVTHEEKILRPRTGAEELRRLATKYAGARDKTNKPIIESIWPDRFNPKLPEKFSDIEWTEVSGTGIEAAAVNYATGGLAGSVKL